MPSSSFGAWFRQRWGEPTPDGLPPQFNDANLREAYEAGANQPEQGTQPHNDATSADSLRQHVHELEAAVRDIRARTDPATIGSEHGLRGTALATDIHEITTHVLANADDPSPNQDPAANRDMHDEPPMRVIARAINTEIRLTNERLEDPSLDEHARSTHRTTRLVLLTLATKLGFLTHRDQDGEWVNEKLLPTLGASDITAGASLTRVMKAFNNELARHRQPLNDPGANTPPAQASASPTRSSSPSRTKPACPPSPDPAANGSTSTPSRAKPPAMPELQPRQGDPYENDWIGVPYYVELHPADTRRALMTMQPDTLHEAHEIILERLEFGFRGTATVFGPDGQLVSRHDGVTWTHGAPASRGDHDA